MDSSISQTENNVEIAKTKTIGDVSNVDVSKLTFGEEKGQDSNQGSSTDSPGASEEKQAISTDDDDSIPDLSDDEEDDEEESGEMTGSSSKRRKSNKKCNCAISLPQNAIIHEDKVSTVQLQMCFKCEVGVLRIVHDVEAMCLICMVKEKDDKGACYCPIKLKSETVEAIKKEGNLLPLCNRRVFKKLVDTIIDITREKFPPRTTLQEIIRNSEHVLPFTWNELAKMELQD